MSETGFRIFSQTFPLGAELLHALLLAAFFRPFMAARRRNWQKLLGLCLLYLLLAWTCSQAALPQGSFGLLLTALLLAGSKGLGVRKSLVFLLTLLYFNARVSSGLAAESLCFLTEQRLPLPMEPLEAIFRRAAGLVTLFLLLHTVLFALMLYTLQRQIKKRRIPLYWRELCYLSLIPAAGILFGQMISRLLVERKDGVLLQLYERHPAFLAAVPLLALLFYAGTCLTIAFQQGTAALQEEQAVSFMERQQLQSMQARIRQVEQSYAHIRELRHEMRGHLTNIKGLAHSGQYDSLEAYITQIDRRIREAEQMLQTGNPVADVIISDAKQRSLELGADFQVDFHYPERSGFDAFELGIILQNLLQNALEACEQISEGRRFITLTGRASGRFFLLEVQNSFAGELTFGADGLPVTSKKAGTSLHGIGLANVRREAEKYMGELELKADGQKFSATVLLQEQSCL